MKTKFKILMLSFAFIIAKNSQAQVPVMSSFPSASAVIFLDFDGQTVTNTSWNFNGPIYAGASGLNNTQITSVFNRVAEDYRPFNVNVTTDSTKYFAAPVTKRMRCILTVTSAWYGNAGGVSFINSFSWGDNTPCWVFSALLGYNEKYIGEATSHEIGHTLGLYHQSLFDASCVKITDYNSGVGSGEIGWAPIMGVGYYRNFTLWNLGPNTYGCNSIQSDLAVITAGTNGFTFRPDDYSNAFNQATNNSWTNNQFTVSGVIEQNTDGDLFKFTLAQQHRFVLDAVPYNIGTGNTGSDLDMQVTLYNSSQVALNSYNPGTLLNSVVDTVLNSGTYYLRIEGKGNMYAQNYASLGSYTLQASLPAATLPLRTLQLQGSLVSEKHKLNWVIDADEQVIEQVLEYSRDGRNFQTVVSPNTIDRNYTYSPNTNGAVQYRLKVTFDNNKTYYSNTITLRNVNNDLRPKLLSNLVSSNLLVTSPSNFDYTVYDMTGKLAGRGKLLKGMNNIPVLVSSGLYVIKFNDDTNQWTDKFVRQ